MYVYLYWKLLFLIPNRASFDSLFVLFEQSAKMPISHLSHCLSSFLSSSSSEEGTNPSGQSQQRTMMKREREPKSMHQGNLLGIGTAYLVITGQPQWGRERERDGSFCPSLLQASRTVWTHVTPHTCMSRKRLLKTFDALNNSQRQTWNCCRRCSS